MVPATGSPPPRHLHAPESDADREPRRGRHDREYDSEEIVPGPSRPDRLGRLSSSQRDRRDRSSSSDWYEACRSTSNAGVNTIACMFSPSEEDMSSAVKDDAGVDQLLKEWTTLYDEPPDVVESDAM